MKSIGEFLSESPMQLSRSERNRTPGGAGFGDWDHYIYFDGEKETGGSFDANKTHTIDKDTDAYEWGVYPIDKKAPVTKLTKGTKIKIIHPELVSDDGYIETHSRCYEY